MFFNELALNERERQAQVQHLANIRQLMAINKLSFLLLINMNEQLFNIIFNRIRV